MHLPDQLVGSVAQNPLDGRTRITVEAFRVNIPDKITDALCHLPKPLFAFAQSCVSVPAFLRIHKYLPKQSQSWKIFFRPDTLLAYGVDHNEGRNLPLD